MKKQKQNSDILVWQNINQKEQVFYLLAFFGIAIILSWWYVWHYYGALFEIGTAFFSMGQGSKISTAAAAAIDNTPAVIVYTRRLDGFKVNSGEAAKWPYAVMVENLREVRPQSGLSQASVVYETLAEGGATRFMAVFDPQETVKEIMPVRSARPYYLEWVSEYGALYAHAGGSPKALTVIGENPDIKNLDALLRDGKYFWRDASRGAPHNLVTSSEKMNAALRDKSLAAKTANFQPWVFKDDALLSERGADGKTATFNFTSGLTYQVDFKYRQAENDYLRFNADEPHLDKNTGRQIAVKNVIVQLVPEPGFDNTGKGRLDIYVGGTGRAWIFRDGQVLEGTWQKHSRTDRTVFYDPAGKEVELNRGNTWVHVVPKDQAVSYK